MADYISKFQYNGTTWDMKDAEARQALASCVNNGYYDSNAKKIILRHDSTTIVQIDATDFIKDGMVSNVQVVNGYLVITFNTDAGQEPIRIPITDIFNPDNYYTKSATNGLLALKQDIIQDLAQIRQGANAGATAYQKPQGGIPKSDMSEDVKEALQNAEDAITEEEVENQYARQDGYYETLGVGEAKNIIGQIPQEAGFIYRTAGGNNDIADGLSHVKNIQGNVVSWNQLIENPNDWVDMGLPSGTLWCKKNLDATQPNGLAASEFQYECTFFSWGNKEGHNPVNNSFVYNWGRNNNGPYAQTEGAALTSATDINHDGAINTIGACFRDPSNNDFVELFNNIDYVEADGVTVVEGTDKLVTINDVVGIYLRSKINGNLLFFPCSGCSNFDTTWGYKGSYGFYWSRELSVSQSNGKMLIFNSGSVNPQSESSRYRGCVRRPVLYRPTSTQDGKNNHKYAVSSNGKNITDVTITYGTGNEPSSVAQFEQDYFNWFGKPLDYEPYNEGTLIPMKMQGIKTVGFNQWDEQWELGSISRTTGANQLFNDRIRSKNFIHVISNTYYYIKSPQGLNWCVFFYDSNKQFLSYINFFGGGIFNTGNASYIKHAEPYSGYGATYKHDICINLSFDGHRNGEYEPYKEHNYDFDVTRVWGKLNGEGSYVQIAPDGLKSATPINSSSDLQNAVADLIEFGEDGVTSDIKVSIEDGELVVLETPLHYTDLMLDKSVAGDGSQLEPITNVRPIVDNYGTEEIVVPASQDDTPTSCNPWMTIQYDINAAEHIDTFEKHGIKDVALHDNLQALCNVINTNCSEQLGGTIAISAEPNDNLVYSFTFTANA